jgi:hypothetical protein
MKTLLCIAALFLTVTFVNASTSIKGHPLKLASKKEHVAQIKVKKNADGTFTLYLENFSEYASNTDAFYFTLYNNTTNESYYNGYLPASAGTTFTVNPGSFTITCSAYVFADVYVTLSVNGSSNTQDNYSEIDDVEIDDSTTITLTTAAD